MKAGDLVKTKDGQLGIVKQYRPELDGHSNFKPCILYMINDNWKIKQFLIEDIEVISDIQNR